MQAAFIWAATSTDARQNFLSLYPNRHKSILKWPGRDWVTVSHHGCLSDETILSAVSLQEKTFWGCRWGRQTRFVVLDVDNESQYHNQRLVSAWRRQILEISSLWRSQTPLLEGVVGCVIR
jgi:hypothetical protein